MGLLDYGFEDPNTAGLLSLGLRLMSTPGKFGTALGQAGLGAMGDMQRARAQQQDRQQAAQRQQLFDLQMKQAQQAQADAELARANEARFRGMIPDPSAQAAQAAMAGGGGPTLANAQQIRPVDPQQQMLFNAMSTGQIRPMEYLSATAKDDAPVKLGEGETLYSGKASGYQPLARGMPKADAAAPAAVREYQFAKEQGYPGSFQQFQIEQKRAGASNVNVNNADNKFDAKAAEVVATQFAETYKQGQAATRALGQVNRLDGLLKKTGGGFTPAIKVYAGQFGVNTNGLDDLQTAEAVIQSLIPQQRPPGSGTMSDRDVELFRQSLPRLINQPGGNQKIISTMRGLYEYDQKLGQISSDALSGKITRDRAMELMNALPNPLADLTGGEDIRSQADAIIKGGVNGKR